jgi:hypothetical protein
MRMTLLAIVLCLVNGCSYFERTKEPSTAETPRKSKGITEMTCYQDCRNDLQSDEFCRARCTD